MGVILDLGKKERMPEKIVTEKKWPEGRKQESVVSLNFKAKEILRRQVGKIQEGSRKVRPEKGPLNVVIIKRSLWPWRGQS